MFFFTCCFKLEDERNGGLNEGEGGNLRRECWECWIRISQLIYGEGRRNYEIILRGEEMMFKDGYGVEGDVSDRF